MTRRDLLADTGLSKATISRVVDDLERLGLLAPDAGAATPASPEGTGTPHDGDTPAASRGRRPTALTVPPAVGQVIGISFGLQRTGVLAIDLAGRELSWETLATPPHVEANDAVEWLGALIARSRARTAAPLLRVVVAVPTRVVDGAEVPHPPSAMPAIGGTAFARLLAAASGCEVVLDTDANMALAGLTVEGVVPGSALPVLLNMSTVLTMAMLRRDGSAAQGVTSSFGNFSVLPFSTGSGGESTLGAMLSTHGLEDYAASRGVTLSHVSELWGGDDELERFDATPPSAAHETVVGDFADALVSALLMISVVSDPLLIVLAGRLAPLAERVLPQLTTRLDAALDEPPQILVANARTRCHSTSLGAAHSALDAVQQVLRRRLANGYLTVT